MPTWKSQPVFGDIIVLFTRMDLLHRTWLICSVRCVWDLFPAVSHSAHSLICILVFWTFHNLFFYSTLDGIDAFPGSSHVYDNVTTASLRFCGACVCVILGYISKKRLHHRLCVSTFRHCSVPNVHKKCPSLWLATQCLGVSTFLF